MSKEQSNFDISPERENELRRIAIFARIGRGQEINIFEDGDVSLMRNRIDQLFGINSNGAGETRQNEKFSDAPSEEGYSIVAGEEEDFLPDGQDIVLPTKPAIEGSVSITDKKPDLSGEEKLVSNNAPNAGYPIERTSIESLMRDYDVYLPDITPGKPLRLDPFCDGQGTSSQKAKFICFQDQNDSSVWYRVEVEGGNVSYVFYEENKESAHALQEKNGQKGLNLAEYTNKMALRVCCSKSIQERRKIRRVYD